MYNMGNIWGYCDMDNFNKDDKLFDEIFGDLFKNPPTQEEIEARKREEERDRQIAIENRRQFNAYAMTLPGAEKVRDDNPVMEIRGGVDENGNFYQRTVTRDEYIAEMMDDLFGGLLGRSEDEKETKHHK